MTNSRRLGAEKTHAIGLECVITAGQTKTYQYGFKCNWKMPTHNLVLYEGCIYYRGMHLLVAYFNSKYIKQAKDSVWF